MIDLKALAFKLLAAKEAEKAAKDARIAVESEIYIAVRELNGGSLPEKGTVHSGPIDVGLGIDTSWDQDKLNELSAILPPERFPFRKEFKCDARALTKLATAHPAEYRQIFPAMTTKPKKPSFAVNVSKLAEEAA